MATGGILLIADLIAIAISTIRRMLRSTFPERQQIAWLLTTTYVNAFICVLQPLPWLGTIASAFGEIPVAIAVGVLRYRLLGIEVVVPPRACCTARSPRSCAAGLRRGHRRDWRASWTPTGRPRLVLAASVIALVLVPGARSGAAPDRPGRLRRAERSLGGVATVVDPVEWAGRRELTRCLDRGRGGPRGAGSRRRPAAVLTARGSQAGAAVPGLGVAVSGCGYAGEDLGVLAVVARAGARRTYPQPIGDCSTRWRRWSPRYGARVGWPTTCGGHRARLVGSDRGRAGTACAASCTTGSARRSPGSGSASKRSAGRRTRGTRSWSAGCGGDHTEPGGGPPDNRRPAAGR